MSLAASGTVVDAEALLRLRHFVAEARRASPPDTTARPGPVATKRRGRGLEPYEIRAWAHGDDNRHIDRNVTARTGVPHVKTFRDEREEATMLVADFRPSMLFGTRRALRSVAAAEILALAGWRAAGTGGRIGLVAVHGMGAEVVRPMVGERAMIGVVGALCRVHAAAMAARREADPPLTEALALAVRALPRGGTIVLASGLDAPGEGFDAAAAGARSAGRLRVAVVSDAFERHPPPGTYPYLVPPGTRGRYVVDAAPPPPRAERWIERLRSAGVASVVFAAEDGPEAQLRSLETLVGDRP